VEIKFKIKKAMPNLIGFKTPPDLEGQTSSSPMFDIKQLPEEDQILQKKANSKASDQMASKIRQAKELLKEVLEDPSNPNLQAPILDGIKSLEYIEKVLQDPQGNYCPNPKEQAIQQIQLEIAKINAKVDQILEKPKLVPTYAEILQNQQSSNQLSSQMSYQSNSPQISLPPSPRVVIPVRKDLEKRRYIRASPKQQSNGPTRAMRLILKVPMELLDNLDSIKLRDQINDKFYKNGYQDPIVATISRSITNLSLVITTMENYSGLFLLEKKALWGKLIPYTRVTHDIEWVKLVVHTVPTRPFQIDEGKDLMRSEIETFNPKLKLMRNPIWLSNKETRT
jgi:hypothetical protein